MARVTLDRKVFTDPRILVLGNTLGLDRFSVLGRLSHLWSYCTEEQIYSVSEVIIDAVTEIKGFTKALVECGLAVLSRGKCRIKGLKGRIEWLGSLRRNGSLGGRPKKPDGYQKVTRSKPEQPPISPVPTPVSKSLSLLEEHNIQPTPQSLEKRWKAIPTKLREKETRIFSDLHKQYGDDFSMDIEEVWLDVHQNGLRDGSKPFNVFSILEIDYPYFRNRSRKRRFNSLQAVGSTL